MFIISFSLCTYFLWQLNPKTLTQVRGYTLLGYHFFVFFKNRVSHPIFTQVRTGSSIFNQDIIHGDTVRGSDWDA
jgi:hypothetical protein